MSYEDSEETATWEHTCDDCHGTIAVGELFRHVVERGMGSTEHTRTHLVCP